VYDYITNIVYLLHVSATHVASLREVHYRGWLHQDIVASEEEPYRNYNEKTSEVLTEVLMTI
jgi:hypothetical protein